MGSWSCLFNKLLKDYIEKHWDAPESNYFFATRQSGRSNLLQLKEVSKAALIISLFTEDGANPKDIEEQVGFTIHNEMTTFMKIKKYEWDVNKSNYTKINKEEVESGSNVRQLNFESEALEEILMEVLQGINELKSGKKTAKTNDNVDEESSELPRYI